jgi:hypothetical protein
VPVTQEQHTLQELLLALSRNNLVEFLRLYPDASARLQAWFFRGLTKVFGPADKFVMQVDAFKEMREGIAGGLTGETVQHRLLFYRPTAPAGAYSPVYTGKQVSCSEHGCQSPVNSTQLAEMLQACCSVAATIAQSGSHVIVDSCKKFPQVAAGTVERFV